MSEITTPQVPNPTGKGGFGDHPENRSPGGWKKEENITNRMQFFGRMNEEEIRDWQKKNPNPTVFELIALNRVLGAMKKLDESTFVANRTEGMPKQVMEMGVDDTITKVKVKIEVTKDGTKPESDNGIPEELPAVPEADPIGDKSGGQGVEQNVVAGPTVPADTSQ
jgi:hypothetical protein